MLPFAGGAADAMALMDRLEVRLEAHPQNVRRAAVELAKEWRTDRVLRRLEAMIVVADPETLLVVSGNGDVIEPEAGVLAIGSGGNYARAAATALAENTELGPEDVVRKALTIAGDICVYTNHSLTIETLNANAE